MKNSALHAVIWTYRMVPDWGLSTSKQSGVKGVKVQLTYVFMTNADGSDKLQLSIIGKAVLFKRNLVLSWGFIIMTMQRPGWLHTFIKTGLNNGIGNLWKRSGRFYSKITSLATCSSRPEGDPCWNFQPNLMAHVQPNDQGIIQCFKAHYWARFIQQAVNQYDEGVTPAEIYNINQLQAMRMAESAWQDVIPSSCHLWVTSGL